MDNSIGLIARMTVFAFLLFSCDSTLAGMSKCVENADVVLPLLSKKAAKIYKSNLTNAQRIFDKSPNDVDAVIWLGRRTAYLGNYKAAIEIYTKGIKTHPNDARIYRHRGHRFISIRCFDDAIADFTKASQLIYGKPDQVEPDGLPNARNIPTSTLQSNIWYHLGLAYYLKRDFKSAVYAYREGLKVSKNPDMLVATSNWLYVSLRKSGERDQARVVLQSITDGLDIIENDGYYKLLKVYQRKLNARKLLRAIGSKANNLGNVSIGYGLGNWHLVNGRRREAQRVFRKITRGNQWSSFGYIASEVELNR